MKKRILLTIWQIILIMVGSTISAFGIVFLIMPHNLLTGGVSGTSLLLSYFTPIRPDIWIALLNIPLFVIAWKKIDFKFCLYSILGVASLSIAMGIFIQVGPLFEIKDSLLAALFGGMLTGGGIGLAIRGRGSQGGTDIISVVIRRRFSIGIGMFSFYVNIILVSILSIKFGIELGLLTVFSQFVAAKALDKVVIGLNTSKAVTIISDHAEEISEYIMKKLYRGVTFLEGQGAYGKDPKKVIWCIVTTSQLARVKGAMFKIDPNAFMSISDASETIGQGFYKSPI